MRAQADRALTDWQRRQTPAVTTAAARASELVLDSTRAADAAHRTRDTERTLHYDSCDLSL